MLLYRADAYSIQDDPGRHLPPDNELMNLVGSLLFNNCMSPKSYDRNSVQTRESIYNQEEYPF